MNCPGLAALRAAAPARWPWPLPALFGWGAAWAMLVALRAAQAPALPALAAATATGLAIAWPQADRRRRAIVAGGFPLSALAAGWAAALPAWSWLVALAPLLALYPLRAWRDAPWFPTPARALAGLERVVSPAPARVLDAGCGLGHGLAALRSLWPEARIDGVEWSRPLAWWAARRCRWAGVRRGDLWADSWARYELVYLFQRPETMARAWAKAQAQMRPGCWLVSLEFEVPGVAPVVCLGASGRRRVWVYRLAAPKKPSTGGGAGR